MVLIVKAELQLHINVFNVKRIAIVICKRSDPIKLILFTFFRAMLADLVENLLLPGGIVRVDAQLILNPSNLDGCLHAVVEQANDLLVNPVDFIP